MSRPTPLAELLADAPPVSLGPGKPNAALHRRIESACATLTPACRSGLWLWFDFLDESHAISQDLNTAEGSFWHAIMHRREPDAWNAKYWFRKVGSHPVLDQLRDRTPEVGYTFAGPADFVDFCERVRGSGSADEEIAKRVQAIEWELLFAWCLGRR
ncbi:MAG: hypothetical protein K2V38_05435 [Gemmataceae bacterium]|nr:hypothetical protein [Gemmataceae bacterium]